MVLRKVGLLAALSVSATLMAGAAAFAMPGAATGPGYTAGAEIGAAVSHGVTFAAAGDINYGLNLKLLNQPYTDVFADVLYTGRKFGGTTVNTTAIGVGLRQPIPIGGSIPISVEGGFTNISVNQGFGSSSSGFIGGRASFAQTSSGQITVMGRYMFTSPSAYQLGVGYSGVVGKGSGLTYQADYYHLGFNGGVGLDSDSILVGVRFSGTGF
ncbi:MAG: hypothetical protein M3Y56_11805 [Armatimonadota bacterium]|nr:hypothetical protein [Armatimonadota bacterium]